MSRKYSTRLVIDTDVAQAAGNKNSVHPTGQRCRDFLMAVRDNHLLFVMTPEIKKEWNKHQSNFARKWRRSMISRKQFCNINPASYQTLLDRLEDDSVSKNQMAAMKKDWHVVEAALETDRTVASKESIVRELFAKACGRVAELQAIVWVNPDQPEEGPIEWLERGAPPDEHRKLGWKT